MAQMSTKQRDAFLHETRIAALITLNPDGSPTAAAIWYEWDGAVARMFTSRTSDKIRRLRRDPRACLHIEEGVGVPEAWVSLEGTIAIEEQGGMELARRLASRYYPADKAEKTLVSWEKLADQWVVLALTPARIRTLAPE